MPRIITLTPNPTYDFAVDADFVEPNRKLRCHNAKSHPGGGGVNVARAANRLGADTLAILTAGGLYGDAVKGLLGEELVPIRSVPVNGETRIAFHVHNLKDDQEFRFNLPGAEMTEREINAFMTALKEEVQAGDYVVGSGSLPAGKPDDFWARAARVTKEHDARFVLDSIHGVRAALDEGIYFLRLNKFEYPDLSGRELQWPEEVIAFAQSIVKAGGAERVAVTQGGDGTVMVSPESVVRTPVIKVKAESAVGAGDSFVAAVVAAMLDGQEDLDCLWRGAAAAAATRMTPGTTLFHAEDVERLFREATADPR